MFKNSELTQEASVALMRWLSQATKSMGVAQHVYVVGGAVRNFLIDQPIKDIDMVVDSLAIGRGRDASWVAKEIARRIPALTDIVTDALMVSKVFIKGSWVLEGFQMEGEVIEIVNAREEVYEEGSGHKPIRVDPTTLERDVLRREFTFNTLMWRLLDLAEGPDRAEVIDLTGCGIKDLNNKEMRCPQDPNRTFFEDPTRIIRTIKFAFKYGFSLPPDVKAAARKQAPQLKRIPSKTWSVLQTVVLDNPQYKKALDVMLDLGVVEVLTEMIQEDQAFATTLSNYAEKQGVAYLFDLMDVGIPVKSILGLFTSEEQARIREVTISMPREEALGYVGMLKNPGVAYADKNFVPNLARELGVKPKDMVTLMPKVTQAGRTLLLREPSLASDPALLRELVRLEVTKNIRLASQW
jgi:tRNA nucleotidyltransferase/poly(A) polymerase